ncbi:MAG: hypothetical protein A3F17_09220 [Gammaproteobacteria bacterium RIFCSPHIGHO2_12_FULL_41_15]|nr:MAG: hypothetical protein A3F17_09220 [Gammaproteobacteria bacterium RIFCSPHIGHO2_12_FULL_41_15]
MKKNRKLLSEMLLFVFMLIDVDIAFSAMASKCKVTGEYCQNMNNSLSASLPECKAIKFF